MIASIAVALILMSLKTLQAIKHLGVGKSFWMPVAVSGFFFFFGSIIATLFELNFSLTEYTDEVVQTSRFFALCILIGGVYSYSRKVTKNLGEKFTLTEKTIKANDSDKVETPVIAPPVTIQESSRRESEYGCKHKFGYLRTLQIDAAIPDECLSCDRIVECKHSSARTIKSKASSPA
jgi:hypothetical protein